jgi:hypothetical protein
MHSLDLPAGTSVNDPCPGVWDLRPLAYDVLWNLNLQTVFSSLKSLQRAVDVTYLEDLTQVRFLNHGAEIDSASRASPAFLRGFFRMCRPSFGGVSALP